MILKWRFRRIGKNPGPKVSGHPESRNVNLHDVQPFVDLLTSDCYRPEAEINQDGTFSLLDVDPFGDLLVGP